MSFRFFSSVAVVVLLAFVFLYFIKPDSNMLDYRTQAQLMVRQCATETSKQTCYSEAFAQLASKEGLVSSAKVLNVLQTFDADTRECHGLAHVISVAAVHKSPSSWINLISQAGMADCAGGYLHGIIEGHIAYDPNFTVNANSITEICNKQSNIVAHACAHGFGHVLLFQTTGDVSKASKVCADVGPLASECYNGMFMEDAFKDMLFEHGVVKERSNPTIDAKRFAEVKSLCHEFKNNSTASYACWSNLGHIIADFYKHDAKKVYTACNQGSTENEKRGCYFRAISSLIILPDFSETKTALSLCTPYLNQQDSKAYERCIEYITATLVYHSSEYIDRAINICSSADIAVKRDCFKVIGFIFADQMSPQEKQIACKNVPDNYRELCLSPSGNQELFRIF